MSRLIDADTTIHVQIYDDMTEEWCLKETTVASALDDWADEGCPPTVDAIPIEWMLKWDETLTDESKEIGSTVNWNIVKWMILEWKKDNG